MGHHNESLVPAIGHGGKKEGDRATGYGGAHYAVEAFNRTLGHRFLLCWAVFIVVQAYAKSRIITRTKIEFLRIQSLKPERKLSEWATAAAQPRKESGRRSGS
jgi:hypothetical protein